MNQSKPQARLLLVGETFSPWTKKARWGLERCGVRYDYQEYTPTLSEPGLRWRMRQFTGSVSVPVLFVGKQIIRGSWDIVSYANAVSDHAPLGDLTTIAHWDMLSERALAEGRTRVVRAIKHSDAALEESLPGFIPQPLRKPLRLIARDAVTRLDRKYAHLYEPGAIRSALEATRNGLDQSGQDYLLGNFSYADITMAVVLEVIAPIARTEPPLGSATAACWNDIPLAEEFADLIQWRNRLAADQAASYSQFQ